MQKETREWMASFCRVSLLTFIISLAVLVGVEASEMDENKILAYIKLLY